MKIGQISADHFEGQANTTKASRRPGTGDEVNTGTLHLAELLDLMMLHRVPGNIETAAFTAAVVDMWEDAAVISLLNAALNAADASLIRTGEAVRLFGTLEVVNGEAAVNSLFFGHGGTPDNDDTRRPFATAASIGSEFIRPTDLITDPSGNIKIETDDIVNVMLIFHLEGYQYVRVADSSV